jgi:hypothetical protein
MRRETWPTDHAGIQLVVAVSNGGNDLCICGVQGRLTVDMLQQLDVAIRFDVVCGGLLEDGEYLCRAEWVQEPLRQGDRVIHKGWWNVEAIAHRTLDHLLWKGKGSRP